MGGVERWELTLGSESTAVSQPELYQACPSDLPPLPRLCFLSLCLDEMSASPLSGAYPPALRLTQSLFLLSALRLLSELVKPTAVRSLHRSSGPVRLSAGTGIVAILVQSRPITKKKRCSCAPCRLDPCRSHLSGLHGVWRELPSQPQYRHAAQVRLLAARTARCFGPPCLRRSRLMTAVLLRRCYEMERRLKTPDLFKFPYFEAICWYVAKNLLEMLKGERAAAFFFCLFFLTTHGKLQKPPKPHHHV